jgi:integrase
VDVDAKIAEIAAVDPRIGVQLDLQRAFGLRLREACLLRPHLADNATFLAVNWGTKGSRDRIVPIDSPDKRAVLDRAKGLVRYKSESLVPGDKTWPQWRAHVYYVLRKHGVTRDEGITSHGLRHEYLNDLYEQHAGEKSPVRGGGRIDPEAEKLARHVVAEHAGHGRPEIASAYIGSHKKHD